MTDNHSPRKLLPIAVLCLATILCLSGCPSLQREPEAIKPDAGPEVSEYPLRVWIASSVSDASRIERQWLAGSDQPIEIRSLSTVDLLHGDNCECDLLFFPSRLLGDMVRRDWIVKLPDSVLGAQDAMENDVAPNSTAAVAQSAYGGVTYALSLGCSVPAVVASESLGEQVANSPTTWNKIISMIETESSFALPAEEEIDRQALVDRFLTIVASQTDRNPNYGLLFELQTMAPRLSKPEFVAASMILKRLSLQKGGARAVVGSHNVAWEFATQSSGPAVAIAAPALISQENAGAKAGTAVAIVPSGKFNGWNTGSGLVVALAADCRQTSLTVGMLKWLRQNKTRNALAAVVEGVETTSPQSGTDSLSWQVRSQLGASLKDANLPQEPKLPRADNFREALATELLKLLTDEKTASQALEDAAEAWSAIIEQCKFDVQAEYEKSLGLSL